MQGAGEREEDKRASASVGGPGSKTQLRARRRHVPCQREVGTLEEDGTLSATKATRAAARAEKEDRGRAKVSALLLSRAAPRCGDREGPHHFGGGKGGGEPGGRSEGRLGRSWWSFKGERSGILRRRGGRVRLASRRCGRRLASRARIVAAGGPETDRHPRPSPVLHTTTHDLAFHVVSDLVSSAQGQGPHAAPSRAVGVRLLACRRRPLHVDRYVSSAPSSLRHPPLGCLAVLVGSAGVRHASGRLHRLPCPAGQVVSAQVPPPAAAQPDALAQELAQDPCPSRDALQKGDRLLTLLLAVSLCLTEPPHRW